MGISALTLSRIPVHAADVERTLLALNVHRETIACTKKHLDTHDGLVSEAFGLLSYFAANGSYA